MKKIIILFFLILFSNFSLQPATVGDDSSEGLPIGITLFEDQGNKIANYAVMDSGFSFADKKTTCSFASLFPVQGPATLRGGRLFLFRDFAFTADGHLTNACIIYGNDHSFIISRNAKDINSGKYGLDFIDDHHVGEPIYDFAWSHDGQYLALEKVNSISDVDLLIYQFDGSTITYKTQWGSAIWGTLRSIEWHPSAYYIATGDHTAWEVRIFKYNPGTNSVSNPSNLPNIDPTDAVTWHPSGNYLATGQRHGSEPPNPGPGPKVILYPFNSGTGAITESGAIRNSTHPNVSTSTTVYIAQDSMSWDPTGDYLAVGYENTGDSDHELVIFYFNGSTTLTYTLGLNLGVSVNHLDCSPIG